MYTILIIEDEETIRLNVTELLLAEGYNVKSAENGNIGIEKAKTDQPDLIICDIMMPGYNGFEVLDELSKNAETANIPFIFLTAKTEMENLRKGMNLGADDYIFKPFDLDDLLSTVETRLRKKEVDKQLFINLQEQLATKIPHELRTPLVPILGFSEIIEYEDDPVAIKGFVKNIYKSGKILNEKIEKFLLFKDLVILEKTKNSESQEPSTSEVSQEYIFNVIEKLPKDLNPSKRCKVKIEMQTLPISFYYLESVIKELVENALRYSNEETIVTISGSRCEDRYILKVKDNGKGLTEAQIRKIAAFKKFGETQFSDNGLGLGLTIAMKIIDQVNGSFSIKSELDNFTEVKLSFPV